MSSIRELNSLQQLDGLSDAWRELHAVTPSASFFQSLEWLSAYWRHYGHTQRLRVLLQERHGEIVGILPLVVRKERTQVGSLRFATYPLDYWGSFYGPLGEFPGTVLDECVAYLLAGPRDWDVLEPRWIGVADGERDRVESALVGAGLTPLCSVQDTTAVIELPAAVETYWSSRTPKCSANRRRWERRLQAQGVVRYERFRSDGDGNPRWDLFDQCLDVAERSWQHGATGGTTMTHGAIAPFLHDVHEAASASGGVDVNLLYVNDLPIAFAYNYCYRGHVFGLRVGYDAEFHQAGAGALLCAMSIEDSILRGDWRYDLGPGGMEHKRHFMTHPLPMYRFSCYRTASLKQQLLRIKRSFDARAAAALEAIESLA
ncbi:MAG: GNAT family N-acetyltransferase, partial [Planctomycetota bacterium]